jgi:hypothetical protein
LIHINLFWQQFPMIKDRVRRVMSHPVIIVGGGFAFSAQKNEITAIRLSRKDWLCCAFGAVLGLF